MVRLVVESAKVEAEKFIKFQFHYGTIGSVIVFNAIQIIILFQFHYGTIGSYIRITSKGSTIRFQFHYGTIGRNG